MADDGCFQRVAEWVQSDKEIKAVVLSAGGKTAKSKKVTDILVDASKDIKSGRSVLKSLNAFFERVKFDAEKLGLYEKIKNQLMIIEQKVEEDFSLDFVLSLGEYMYAKMFSYFSGIRFVDSKNLIYFYDDGKVNYGYTEFKIKEEYEKGGRFVTGGFYGGYRNGKVKTFSRGGSDFSGALIAKALGVDEYLNFTDVDGVYSFNPRIVQNAKIVEEINFDSIRILGEFGAGVLHPASVIPLYGTNTKIRLRNTFNKNAKGTLIYENCIKNPYAVAEKDCRYVKIKNQENGYRILERFAKKSVNVICLASSYDFVEICFTSDQDVESLTQGTSNSFIKEEKNVKVFYFTLCEQSFNVIEKIKNEKGRLMTVIGKFGIYVCIREELENNVIKMI
jgi:aspartate kinase